MTASATRRRPMLGQVREARIVQPLLRTLSVVLLIFVAVVSLVGDPEPAIGGGTAFARWAASALLGSPEHADKIEHAVAYAVLGTVTVAAFGRTRNAALCVLVFLVAFGGVLELLQAAGGVRHGDWYDLLADALGVAAGGALYVLLRRIVGRAEPRAS